MKRIKQTKFKLAVGTLAVYLIEGILRTIFKEFPLTELLAAQGAVALGYMGIRLAQNKGEQNRRNDK